MNAPARSTAAAVLGLILFAPAARGQQDKAARRAEQHEYLLGQGRAALFALATSPQWKAADAGDQGLLLRALLASRITPDDPRIREQLESWLARDLAADLLAQTERIWIITLTRASDADGRVRRLVDRLGACQEPDGGFSVPGRGKAEPPDGVLVTGRVLEALAAAERLGVAADARVWDAALGFLLAAQANDGGFPRRANGAATARGLAGLLAGAARVTEPGRPTKALDAAVRAEKWLAQEFRPDRNPGSRRGSHEWLGALEAAMARAWLVRALEHAIADEVFTHLQGAQLPETGWNEEHMPELLRTRPGPGGAAGGGGVRTGNTGTPLVQQTQADLTDTAWAVLFLARSTRTGPRDDAAGAAHRLAALGRPAARAEDGDAFVERARHASAAVVPVLVGKLTADAVLVRRSADGALRALSGKDMGYVPQAAPVANAAAIARWREWARTR